MSPAVFEEVRRFLGEKTDDPEIRARQRRTVKVMFPELYDEAIEKGLAPLAHVAERRVTRPLTGDERRALRKALDRVGANRLGDVVLDLCPAALAAWLADPNAQ